MNAKFAAALDLSLSVYQYLYSKQQVWIFNNIAADAHCHVGMVELLIPSQSCVFSHSLRYVHFYQKFGIAVLTILQEREPILHGIRDVPLCFGVPASFRILSENARIRSNALITFGSAT
jgi:hypothetical protein